MKKFLSMFAMAFVLLFVGFTSQASAVCSVSGQIFDYPSNTAVSGHRVDISIGTTPYTYTYTDSNGQYGFVVPDNSSGYVNAYYTGESAYWSNQAEGFSSQVSYSCGTGTWVSNLSWYRAPAPMTISGNLSYLGTNIPIANREVRIYNNTSTGSYSGGQATGYSTTTTDSNGNFTTTIGCFEPHDIVIVPNGDSITTRYGALDYYPSVTCQSTNLTNLNFVSY